MRPQPFTDLAHAALGQKLDNSRALDAEISQSVAIQRRIVASNGKLDCRIVAWRCGQKIARRKHASGRMRWQAEKKPVHVRNRAAASTAKRLVRVLKVR